MILNAKIEIYSIQRFNDALDKRTNSFTHKTGFIGIKYSVANTINITYIKQMKNINLKALNVNFESVNRVKLN